MARCVPEGLATKKMVAHELGIARSTLYYHKKIPKKDGVLLEEIRDVLRLHPSYGYRRIALHLKRNKKQIQRVMQSVGLKPYRRRGKKPVYAKPSTYTAYPNLIKGWFPGEVGVVWVSDFTYLKFHGYFVYLATVEDMYSREVMGWHVSTSHDAALTSSALFHALSYHKAPQILHSDHGSEYTAKTYTELAGSFSIQLSMSKKASPWENGYQESFFSQFKVDLGDPQRFSSLGELTEYLFFRVHIYNTYRIHSAFKMSPRQYLAQQMAVVG
jgi:transposase InsO family protein